MKPSPASTATSTASAAITLAVASAGLLAALLTTLLISPAALAQAAVPAASAPVTYTDLATEFVHVHDDTLGQGDAARLEAFKRRVLARFPAFYGVARFNGQVGQALRDRQILQALDDFPQHRQAFLAKTAAFNATLHANIAAFRRHFPGFQPTTPIVLLHSLGEFDGAVREFGGTAYLLFGADGLAAYRNGRSTDAPLFQHELFHVLHARHFPSCEPVWCVLWAEGLAVHVEKTLNPELDEAELVVNYPDGLAGRVQAAWADSLRQLRSQLDSEDPALLGRLFSTDPDPSGLPSRRGYVIGWRIAQRLGRSHGLDALARLTPAQVRPLLATTLDELLAEAGQR